jgi:hypothetical protein
MTLRAASASPMYAGSGTWAQIAAINPGTAGVMAFVTNLGTNGTWVRWTGSRWKTFALGNLLKDMGATVSGITNTEQIVCQTLIPAGAWQNTDHIRIESTGGKSAGVADTGRMTVRIGTAGTTADTAITGLSSVQIMTAGQTSFGVVFDVRLQTATSAQKLGTSANGSSGWGGGAGSASSAATTITDASANPLYISVGFNSSGATETLSVTSSKIILISS